MIGLFLVVSFSMAQGTEEKSLWISYVEGTVGLNSQRAQINLVILTNDRLETEDGRIEITKQGNYIRIGKYTLVYLVLQGDLIILDIKRGNVIIENQGLDISIITPHKQDSGLIGSYRIIVGQNRDDDFNAWNKQRKKEIKQRIKQLRQRYSTTYQSRYYSSRNMYWRLRLLDGYRSSYLFRAILPYGKSYYRGGSTVIHKNQLRKRK